METQNNEPTTLLRKRDAARALAMCPRMIDYFIQRGELPIVKLGRATRIKLSDLENFIDVRTQSQPVTDA